MWVVYINRLCMRYWCVAAPVVVSGDGSTKDERVAQFVCDGGGDRVVDTGVKSGRIVCRRWCI